MIDVLIDTWTMVEKPIPDHYYKYAGKHYGTPSTRLFDTSLNIGKRCHTFGRHPFNILTEEIYNNE